MSNTKLDASSKEIDTFKSGFHITDYLEDGEFNLWFSWEELDELIEVLLGIRDKRKVQQQTEANLLLMRKWRYNSDKNHHMRT